MMLLSEKPFYKEKDIIFENNNDLFEKTNFATNIFPNNNSFFTSPISNFDLNSLNDSFSVCNDLNIDYFLYIKNNNPSSSKVIIKNDEERIINKDKKIEHNNLIPKFKLRRYKIFNIIKCIKLGRNRKLSNKKGKHDKFKKDNLIIRFKVRLLKNIYDFVNGCFLINENFNYKNKINVIKKLSSLKIKSIKKKIILNGLILN